MTPNTSPRLALAIASLLAVSSVYPVYSLAQPGHEEEQAEHTHSKEAGVAAHDDDHDDHETRNEHAEDDAHGGHDEHEEGGLRLSAEQMATAGIKVEALTPQPFAADIQAPGEIRLDAYASSKVVPRIAAQVITRSARLGDEVEKGQALVELSSIDMAEAQGDLLVAEREWRRVRKLGRKVVSEQRYTKAQVDRELARAKVLAYGMTAEAMKALVNSGNAERANGRFQLLAPQHGTVLQDDFVLGELVDAGRVLFEISDESTLWVEARLTPEQASQVRLGSPARVVVQGEEVSGKVIQVHHALDEATRTLGVRIAIANPDDRLHPGLFVTVHLAGSGVEQALAVPEEAVLRSPDGDWQVFVEHEPGEFEPQEVEVLRNSAGRSLIRGLPAGTRVVTAGAFFLQSEQAKSGFDIHNH